MKIFWLHLLFFLLLVLWQWTGQRWKNKSCASQPGKTGPGHDEQKQLPGGVTGEPGDLKLSNVPAVWKCKYVFHLNQWIKLCLCTVISEACPLSCQSQLYVTQLNIWSERNCFLSSKGLSEGDYVNESDREIMWCMGAGIYLSFFQLRFKVLQTSYVREFQTNHEF